MLAAEPDLFVYHQDRRQRRIRVGDHWRKLLGACIQMMRGQWADIDLLLDPYFLHLPTPQDRVRWYPGSVSRAANLARPTANIPEPTDLITVLFDWGRLVVSYPLHQKFSVDPTESRLLPTPHIRDPFDFVLVGSDIWDPAILRKQKLLEVEANRFVDCEF
ncbi:hypothetical protein PHMEG_00020153 [Phytophthora megakarya]|uniref:Uncharacterized protein n=1 Tax=Phytophthora megakarya TaxID=4795 RepID=A0A225VRB9_9STRA|nr:hypothetical protein PHMEG_00020153 [Phytophthora megakarya]